LSDDDTVYTNATAVSVAEDGYTKWLNYTDDLAASAAKNVFKAHKAAVDAGLLDFSEAQYIRYVLNNTVGLTDQIDTVTDLYDSWYYDSVYFSASNWRTIDKGLTSLPRAFGPLVMNRTMFDTRVREYPQHLLRLLS